MKKKPSQNNKKIMLSTAIGASKAVLIFMYGFASSFSKQSHADFIKGLEDFADQLDGVSPKQMKSALYYLKSKNLVDIQTEYNKKAFKLTKTGWLKARKLSKSFLIKAPSRWDRKWRLVIFDIPVEKKNKAESFRSSLKMLGLANLQKSIWVHPYECRDQIYYLAEKYQIQSSVRYVVAEYITGQDDLIKRFELKEL